MGVFARLRAHAGLWALVGLLGGLAVFVTSAVAPVADRIEVDALRQLVSQAPYRERDLTVTQDSLGRRPVTPQGLAETVREWLPDVLREAVQTTWAYQRTTVSTFHGIGATLTGPGVVAAPDRYAPVVALYHQPDLLDEVDVTDGAAPRTPPGGDEIQVIAAVEVAEALGLRPGRVYTLHPGALVNSPTAPPTAASLDVRLVGV